MDRSLPLQSATRLLVVTVERLIREFRPAPQEHWMFRETRLRAYFYRVRLEMLAEFVQRKAGKKQ